MEDLRLWRIRLPGSAAAPIFAVAELEEAALLGCPPHKNIFHEYQGVGFGHALKILVVNCWPLQAADAFCQRSNYPTVGSPVPGWNAETWVTDSRDKTREVANFGELLHAVTAVVSAAEGVFLTIVLGFRTGFVHSKCALVEKRAVQRTNGLLPFFRVGHLYEGKSARSPGVTVRDHRHPVDSSVTREKGSKLLLGGDEIQVADEDVNHGVVP
jgi:hypothetical protein